MAAVGAIADLLPAVAAMLGVPRSRDRIGLTGSLAGVSRVVLLLVDGLGQSALTEHAGLAPHLLGGRDLGGLEAPIPTTTAAALTSLGTGLPVGQHGIVGAAFEVDGAPLWPLSWKNDPNPVATQPEQTVLERLSAVGVAVTSAAPVAFRNSGLTRAALRGGQFPGADTLAERIAVVAQELHVAARTEQPSFTYVYWPDLDKAGHVHGVASPQWRAELAAVDTLVGQLVALLRPGAALLVTADHGMIDIPDPSRFDLDRRPALGVGVRRVLGEPRLRHVYCEAGQSGAVLARWKRELAGVAEVVGRDEAAQRWFAPLDPWYAERVGDVVAMARAEHSLVSDRVDRVVSNLRGQHGADSDIERIVPLRAWSG